jgi:hypothetical protein
MSAYEEELERCRIECLAARERERRRVDNMSTEGVVHEHRAARMERQARGQEAVRRAWGAPPTGSSFSNGSAGLSSPRFGRHVTSYRNSRFR